MEVPGVKYAVSSISPSINEPEVTLSEECHIDPLKPKRSMYIYPENAETSPQTSVQSAPTPCGSSRPRRGAASAAVSTIALLAESEAPGAPSPPSLNPAAADDISVARAEAPLCEVCAAPVAEAVSEDAAACRAAAALLGADCTLSWLCRACAELLRAIDGHRRQLEAAQRLFWRRRREGASRKQTININVESSNCNLEDKGDMAADESDSKEEDNNIDDIEAEEEGTAKEGNEADQTAESEPAPVNLTPRRPRSAVKQCPTCGKQFRTWRALDGHVNSHTGTRPYACAHCDRRFSSRPALRQHQGIHFNKWVCEICQKVYSTEPALSTHRSYVHFPERLKNITCPVCGKKFLGLKRYSKHALTHTADTERFVCPEEGCGSSFKTRNALNVHTNKHQGKRFACDQCPALFSSKASMQQHMVRHGAVEAHFACPHCPRRFIYDSILRCHIASTHKAERDCVCEVCGATFTCNSALNSHKLSHQEDRPHVCDVCGSGFKRKQILARHVRFVHNREVTVRCDQCDKGFPTQHKLKIHMRSHTGERPFSCPLCQKRFSQRSHVRSHMQTHAEFSSASMSELQASGAAEQTAGSVAPPALEVCGTVAPPALDMSEVAALLPVVPDGPDQQGSEAGLTNSTRVELVTPPATQQGL